MIIGIELRSDQDITAEKIGVVFRSIVASSCRDMAALNVDEELAYDAGNGVTVHMYRTE